MCWKRMYFIWQRIYEVLSYSRIVSVVVPSPTIVGDGCGDLLYEGPPHMNNLKKTNFSLIIRSMDLRPSSKSRLSIFVDYCHLA